MAYNLPGVENWEIREVPREDRGPIIEKSLDLLESSDLGLRLVDLDAMDLLAIIEKSDEEEELRGLYWLARSPSDKESGIVALGWIDEVEFLDGASAMYQKLREAIDEWARGRGLKRMSYITRDGYKKAKQAGVWIGFKPSPLREFVREVRPE